MRFFCMWCRLPLNQVNITRSSRVESCAAVSLSLFSPVVLCFCWCTEMNHE
uniref:Uncharacterized protein n=1 Tax=Manihot esculenta TaxID=3983 RepID=A0A2C9U071_MANES